MQNERDPSSEALERQIQEALRKAGADRLPDARPPRRRGTGIDLRLPSPGWVMAAGAILLALQWLRLAFFLGGMAGTIGLALLAFGFLSWLLRPRRVVKYWRERPIELGEGPAPWLEKLYYTIYRR
jgi:hypothetical protein